MDAPLWIQTELPYLDAVAALGRALSQSRQTPPRQIVDTAAGQLLLMPAELGAYAGVKVVSIAPENPRLGLPRIGGIYTLFDSATLRPIAQLDAAALTAVRTAAVSALAVDHLAVPDARRLVIFGAGPQAHSHVAGIAAVRPITDVTILARSNDAARAVARTAEALGLAATTVLVPRLKGVLADQKAPERSPSWHEAEVIACCTTARTPLFDSTVLARDVTVVAVGSHEPDARELDTALMQRATVVVESRASAATAGDIVLADAPIAGDLAELVAGQVVVPSGQPRVFKSVGEAWEDLAIAAALYERVSSDTHDK